MSLLEGITGVEDVKKLDRDQLPQLASEIRQRLIEVVSKTGGHIGAGLGVVELTVALIYTFDSPRDKILWDVGHQGYPWKILTGRNHALPTLRQEGGLSGFLRRVESEHDHFGAGHAGTAMSAALGMAAARDVKGESFHVVAVVGDGALTCGMPYEGMNNAGHSERDIIMIVNDNGMSIAPNVGAISKYFASIEAAPMTNKMRGIAKQIITRTSKFVGGKRMVDFAKNIEESVKNLWSPGMLFEELGFRYFGPIDGHDIPTLLSTLRTLKQVEGPRVLHILTEKGRGFPLEEPDLEKFHARKPYNPVTGAVKPSKGGHPAWTKIFGTAITELAAEHPEIVVITAAMPSGTGTDVFQKRWPDRFFDVGIAEGHGTTFAAGLATQGIRPIVAIYSTFLQRAYDSIIHDVAIQKLPVVFCMDRAGMVGADGQTHMGLYDIAYLLAVPNMTITQPKDGKELVGLLRCALAHKDGPFTLRYPRDNAPSAAPPAAEVGTIEYGTWEMLREGKDCAILAVGVMCEPAMGAAELLEADGFDVSVVNCRFIKPIDRDMLSVLVESHRLFVTVEDGTKVNGFGAYVASIVSGMTGDLRVDVMGAPDRTYEHAARGRQLEWAGLTSEGIAATVRARAAEKSLSTA
ncbi:MAG: 1-deoxy-D-xylulose-5-phosphate synthase [Gemmatimonadetes bacterium]|nr:1-deoxy-D-xylulose-5-phosphate synthase [Gemmatimonadota bacterium]